jgi:DNA-binding transcriptional LysR family regulator
VLAAANGGGLACLARFRGDAEPRLNLMDVPTEPPSADILLLVHKDNRDTPRMRVVLNHITESIQALGHLLQPPGANEEDVRAVGG